MMTKLRVGLVLLMVLGGSLAALAEQIFCDVCGTQIHGHYYFFNDGAIGGRRNVCTNCAKLEARCFICNLPVKTNEQMLPDGRILCLRDAKTIVATEEEAKQICDDARNDLDRLLARFLSYPNTNVVLSIVNRFYLENLFKQPGEGQACVSVYGATTSNRLPGNKIVHSIAILSHLTKARLRAVCAHEYTHAWMGENVSAPRRAALDKNMVEGFCELVAYKYMVSLQETNEVHTILKNDYTKGKIDVMIAADEKYGFETVMEWIKSGDDNTLELDNLDRVRAVQGGDYRPITQVSALVYAPPVLQAAPEPDTLVLKGISGSGTRRFALINGTTFETMEKAKVRVGSTNLTVRCLEISDKAVTIQIEGSSEKKQLALRAQP